MIELKLVNEVCDQAAPISYVYSPSMTIPDNVNLVDYSADRSTNSRQFYQTVSTIEYIDKTGAQGLVLYSDDIVVGNRSVLSSAVSVGTPLFYEYKIGRWGAFYIMRPTGAGAADIVVGTDRITLEVDATTKFTYPYVGMSTRQLIKNVKADYGSHSTNTYLIYPGKDSLLPGTYSVGTSPTVIKFASYMRVYNPQASTSDMSLARDTIKKSIEILADGQKTTEINWDIECNSYETNGFLCTLYIDKKSQIGKTYQIRYSAIDRSGNIYPNTVENINAFPYLVSDKDYTLGFSSDHWYLDTNFQDAVPTGTMAIGIFNTTGSATTAAISSTQITIGAVNYTYTSKSIQQAVAELNQTFVGYTFTLLANKSVLDQYSFVTGSISISSAGGVILLNSELSILSGPDSRIAPLLPYDEESYKPWYPRVNYGRFTEIRYIDSSILNYYKQILSGPFAGKTALTYSFGLPQYAQQTWSKALGSPYKAIATENPIVVSDKIIRTRRFPIEGTMTLSLKDGRSDISNIIMDIDLEQGFIFLSDSVSNHPNINVSYLYEERSLIYTDIDLNTANAPTLVGKFIGLYIVPDFVSYIFSTSTNVHHVIRDTATSIISDVSALAFADGVSACALLLGIYQVIPTRDRSDVKFVDVSVFGGGVKEGVALTEEAKFVTDAGRWDGEPYDTNQAIVVTVPDDVIAKPSPTPGFYNDPTDTSTDGFMYPTELFTKEDIIKKASKWVAPGTVIIVETD